MEHAAHQYDDELHAVKTILEWQAPGRPFRKRDKEFFLSSLLILLLVEIILFLFSFYFLMIASFALVFVSFVLATVPPHDFKYRISTEGVTVEDHFYLWQELYDFYIKKRDGMEVVHIRTRAFLPGELTLTLRHIASEQVKQALLPHLPFREYVKPTFMEKTADWISKNFPLERSRHDSS